MKLVSIAVLLVGAITPVFGQDSAGFRDRRDQLRQLIEERFTERARDQLGLTDEQTAKLRETSRKFGGRRRELEVRGMGIREALSMQLRPGRAADRDSVLKLTEAAAELRVAYAQTFREELRETSKFLDPVQQAQLFTMRDRLLHRAREIRSERWHRSEPWHRDGHGYRRRTPPHDSARSSQ
jgi:hypothetical protein